MFGKEHPFEKYNGYTKHGRDHGYLHNISPSPGVTEYQMSAAVLTPLSNLHRINVIIKCVCVKNKRTCTGVVYIGRRWADIWFRFFFLRVQNMYLPTAIIFYILLELVIFRKTYFLSLKTHI